MNSCRTNWPRKSLQHSIMGNWKWRADMAAIFISRRSMFEHHNFDERRIWRNLGLHMIHINSIIELEMLIPLGWIYVFTAIYRLGLWYLMSQIKDGQKSLWNIRWTIFGRRNTICGVEVFVWVEKFGGHALVVLSLFALKSFWGRSQQNCVLRRWICLFPVNIKTFHRLFVSK